MKPREIFEIAVRIAGLVVFLEGLGHLVYGVIAAAGLVHTPEAISWNGVLGVCEVAAGMLMMRGKTPLVDIAFPNDAPSPKEPETQETKKCEKDDHVA